MFRNDKDGLRVLAMYRKKSDSWHLPKGTKEPNEDIEQTAKREIFEETGFEVTLLEYLGSLESIIHRAEKDIPKKTHYFASLSKTKQQTQHHDHEHDIIEFVEINRLKKLLKEKRIKDYEKEYLILETFLASGVLSRAFKT